MDIVKSTTVGEIVAGNFMASKLFMELGIDFCCQGSQTLEIACKTAGLPVEEILVKLLALKEPVAAWEFNSWPLDLLIDYVWKIYHRGIRTRGPRIAALLQKVVKVHADAHPELIELQLLFAESLQELEMHLQKEENVLFPYLNELVEASLAERPIHQMHCGTVKNPIRVMCMEHEGEGNRYRHIAELTQGYAVPADGCASYRLLMEELKGFVTALYEHIHLENNIIFPRAVELEERWVC